LIYILTNWCLGSTDQRLEHFSTKYLVLDLLLLLGAVDGWWLYGVTFQAFAILFLLASTLVISLTDFRFHLVPDRLTLLGIGVGLLIAVLSDHISMLDAIIGGGTGFALFYIMAVVGDHLLKRESMGGGDIKLAAMLGLFLGWQQLLLAVFLAAVLALVYTAVRWLLDRSSLQARIPFGPFLLYASLIAFALGDGLINSYWEAVDLSGMW
jgi:leader peptidase (prepilin peptidase)/N-methyltransferase